MRNRLTTFAGVSLTFAVGVAARTLGAGLPSWRVMNRFAVTTAASVYVPGWVHGADTLRQTNLSGADKRGHWRGEPGARNYIAQ